MESKNIGATIHVKFKLPTDNIYYIITATGQESKTSAIEGNLRLIKGRIYYIPIDNTDINSDNYNILKVFSVVSDKLDIKFVKEGYCCIVPIVNNTAIKNGQQLCVVHN